MRVLKMADYCQYEEDNMHCHNDIDYAFFAVSCSNKEEEDKSMCFVCEKHKEKLKVDYAGKGFVIAYALMPNMGYDDD